MSAARLQPIRAVAEPAWKADLLRAANGGIKRLLANCLQAFRHAPEWKDVLGFDELAYAPVLLKTPPISFECVPKEQVIDVSVQLIGTVTKPLRPWRDNDSVLACEWLQKQGIEVSVDLTTEAIVSVAREHSFHPIREYLNNCAEKWDRVPRVKTWLRDYLDVEDSLYADEIGRRWLISAVARVLDPGCQADHCLILESPQGKGKSTAMKVLGGEWFTDQIAPLSSKDASMQILASWIIELSELTQIYNSNKNQLKATLSQREEYFRPPYGKALIRGKRSCVFVGTGNKDDYLKDETGNRRFWPVRCGDIDTRKLARDRDQIWGEAIHLFRVGEAWWLDTPELILLAEAEQAERYESDPWGEKVKAFLSPRNEFSPDYLNEILEKGIGKLPATWTPQDSTRVKNILTAQGWRLMRPRAPGSTQRPRVYRRVSSIGENPEENPEPEG